MAKVFSEETVTIKETKVVVENGDTLVLGIYKYGTGQPKFQESRTKVNETGEIAFRKLGRKTFAEMKATLPALKEMYQEMERLQVPTETAAK